MGKTIFHTVLGDSLLFFPKCVFSLQGEKDLKMLIFHLVVKKTHFLFHRMKEGEGSIESQTNGRVMIKRDSNSYNEM